MSEPSLRRVCFENDLDGVRMAVRPQSVRYAKGHRIEVEVGARWTSVDGRRERIPGHWVPCEVLQDSGRDLFVRLLN